MTSTGLVLSSEIAGDSALRTLTWCLTPCQSQGAHRFVQETGARTGATRCSWTTWLSRLPARRRKPPSGAALGPVPDDPGRPGRPCRGQLRGPAVRNSRPAQHSFHTETTRLDLRPRPPGSANSSSPWIPRQRFHAEVKTRMVSVQPVCAAPRRMRAEIPVAAAGRRRAGWRMPSRPDRTSLGGHQGENRGFSGTGRNSGIPPPAGAKARAGMPAFNVDKTRADAWRRN